MFLNTESYLVPYHLIKAAFIIPMLEIAFSILNFIWEGWGTMTFSILKALIFDRKDIWGTCLISLEGLMSEITFDLSKVSTKDFQSYLQLHLWAIFFFFLSVSRIWSVLRILASFAIWKAWGFSKPSSVNILTKPFLCFISLLSHITISHKRKTGSIWLEFSSLRNNSPWVSGVFAPLTSFQEYCIANRLGRQK